MPLRGWCAWTAHFSTICFTRVGECPFTGQHDLPSYLDVEVEAISCSRIGCCRVGRLVQPRPEMEPQRKCDVVQRVDELAADEQAVPLLSDHHTPGTPTHQLSEQHRTFFAVPSQGGVGQACQHDNSRFYCKISPRLRRTR